MKLDTHDEMEKLSGSIKHITKKLGIDMKNDLFEVVQPYKNGESITFKVCEDDEGERVINITVCDNKHILPAVDDNLDVFK